jgi:hypothetical protein
MENESVLEVWPLWIDWDQKILSFREVTGYEKLEFATHEEMFQFAVARTTEGFAIQ